MTTDRSSLDPAYFERLYAEQGDPWDFATSPYEQAKYDHTLEVLPRAKYLSAFEPGCSIGVLTARLADRCEHLLALDAAEAAVVQARQRCLPFPQVRIASGSIPRDWPTGPFDLILLSEVLYYLDRADLSLVADLVRGTTTRQCHVLLVHWTGETDYPLGGDAATEAFVEAVTPTFQCLLDERTDAYRLALLERT
ncbi:SAM-dependent methyltransferase [Xanthobacteraceae bacterium A53D]